MKNVCPKLILLFLLLLLLSFPNKALAATGILKQINFQGKVVNTNGTNVTNGDYSFLFCIYTVASPATACTAGANNDAVWRESKTLTVTDGIFRTQLGDTTALPGSVDFNTDNIYLGTNFNSDGQMTPLVRFTAVPYAFNALKVAGLTVTDTTGTFTLAAAKTLTVNNTLTFAGTDSTTITFQGTDTYIGRATTDTLINKTIGSTGLTFSGATTDITTAAGEALIITPNGAAALTLGTTGAGNTTSITLATDSTGDAEIVLPTDSISTGEILNATIAPGDLNTQGTETDEFCLTRETTGAPLEWQSCGGAASAWSGLSVPVADLALNHVEFTTAFTFDTPTTAAAKDYFTLASLNDATTDSTTQRLLVLNNNDDAISTGLTESLLVIDNKDANDVVTNAILIANSGGGAFTNYINAPNFTVTNAGAVTAVGVNSGSGLLQGTGGLTLTGTAGINTSGSSTTTIGALASTDLILQDAQWNITGAGAAIFATVNGLAVTNNGTNTLNIGAGLTLGVSTASKTLTGAGTTLTFAGDFTTSGANALTLTTTGVTNVTLPTSGTLVNSAVTTLSSLTTVGSLVSGTVIGSQTFTTNNIADSGALTIATGGVGILTARSANNGAGVSGAANFSTGTGTTGTGLTTLASGNASAGTAGNIAIDVGTSTSGNGSILIGNAARAQTITIGNTTGGTITVGQSSGSDLALNDAQWSVTGAGAAAFATVNGLAVTNNGTNTLNIGAGLTLGVSTASKTLTGAGTTLTFAGDFTTSGANALTLTTTGATNVTLPTSGTLVNSAVTTLSSLTTVGSLVSGTVIGSQTFTTNNIADSGALTIATGGTGALIARSANNGAGTSGASTLSTGTGTTGTGLVTLVSGNASAGTAGNIAIDVGTSTSGNGTISIGTAARSQTINIGTNATGGVITIGSATNTGLALSDAQWSVTDVGAATFVSATSPTYTGAAAVTVSSGGSSGLTFDSASGDITVAANDGLTFAATTVGNNGSRNVTIQAGGAGTTATLLVKLDTSGTVITTDTTILNNAVGVALTTSPGGTPVRVAINGVVTATADNAVAAGDYIGVGTATAGRAKSLGTTYPTTAGVQVIGRALGTQATPGSTFLLMLNGLDNSVGTGGGGGYATIQEDGTSLTQRTTLNFIGTSITCADNAGLTKTDCTLSAAGGGVSFASGTPDNTVTSNNLIHLQKSGVNKFVVSNSGGLTLNGTDSSIVKETTTDFSAGTVGSNLTNANNQIEISDGTVPTSGQGTITTASQPVVDSAIGAGAMSITRPDGKYLIIKGGATGTTSLYDSVAGTITSSQTIICNGTTTVGIGALALPRADGKYTLICGVAGSLVGATSVVDPMGAAPSVLGAPLITNAVTGAGTVAFKRPDGKFLVTVGASTPGVTTQIFDPVAATFALGPPATGLGNWAAGALAINRPDGTALMVSGGATSTTAIYNPFGVSATIGTFSGAGPSLDGVQAAGTCGINGAGSVAFRRQDGKFVILSKATVDAIYDPVANTITCRTGRTNVAALGDGAHAIPLQNGKFFILAGGNTTTAFVYNQDTDTYSAYTGTAPTAITTGAHSILRHDGTWQVITGTNTCTAGCTNKFDTGLPMSDPYPAQVTAGAPTATGSCTAGSHSYYVTFVTGGVESELSNKSNIIWCTAGNGTVGLSGIPVGPTGTTARRIYRTPTADTGAPQLVGSGTCVIGDNTTTSCSDTLADASLGAAHAVTAATTWYTSEDISNTALNANSTIRWINQLEAIYTANRNSTTNTAFSAMQVLVKTAINSGGCTTPLKNASWVEVRNPGDLIRAIPGANCAKVSIHFNRPLPKRLTDERGTWIGNNSTVHRLDFPTPTLFGYSIDNSAVLRRTSFDFSNANSSSPTNPTIPAAPTSTAPAGVGSCTAGNHFWFATFVTNGVESRLSPASVVQSCSGSNIETLNPIPIGPSGTTARKIYRTKAAALVTDTPFLVGTQSDNSTTTFADSLADASLGAAFAATETSGPTLSRGESTRVEATNNHLTLPWGRITPTTQGAANALGFYMGAFGNNHPLLNNVAGIGTFVIARDDKTFLVVEGGVAGGAADLYDPATQTFTNQTGTGDKPTATVGSGAFALKHPDGKFLIVLGGGVTTTNIYDQYAPSGSRFTAGPPLFAAASFGAFSILNADGTFTILHGGGTGVVTTSIYDPVRNTMTVGPLQTVGTGMGALAIPLAGPNNNIYKVITGAATVGGVVTTPTMNYNANTKIFTTGVALGVGSGSGAYAFQRQDGFWVLVKGTATGTTSLINPYSGVEAAGVAFTTSTSDRGGHVIPRADGTFLLIGGNTAGGVLVTTNIYVPWGGAFNATAGGLQGLTAVGPTTVLEGNGTVPTAPTSGVPSAGGSCNPGVHFWRYTNVVNGVEGPLSAPSLTQTCVLTTGQTVGLTAVTVGPAGTTARRIYRTSIAGGTTNTSPYFLVGTINDNATTTFSDTFADTTTQNGTGAGIGDGAVSFQRPDGKWVTIFAGTMPSKTTNIYDAGWYADGQYLSEQMNVPALAANSTLDWQQTPDQYVRMEVKSAASQAALSTTGYNSVGSPGGSIGNAGGETWVQIEVNFRRDFPTFSGNLNGVYNSSGGMDYAFRTISVPTVNSYQLTNGMDLLTLQNNGLNMLRVTSNGNIMSSAQGGFFSGGADLAENYTSKDSLEKGEVVVIDKTDSQSVKRSGGQYQNDILGVVSTNPGFVAGAYTEDSYPIALVGRVPVKVSTENGQIKAGDYLTSSSIPGYAMKATMAGRVLGKALEPFDFAQGKDCPAFGLGNLPATKCGEVMMFVNLTDYLGTPVELVMEENRLSGLGLSVTKQDQILAFLKQLKEEQASQSAGVRSEIFTDRVTSKEIIGLEIFADTVHAKKIKADSIEGLEILTDKISSLQGQVAGIATSSASPSSTVNVLNLNANGGLIVLGPSEFKGETVFERLVTFLSNVIFRGKVSFEEVPTFNKDTAGKASFKKGQKLVDVVFDKEYEIEPIVTISLVLSQLDETGFKAQVADGLCVEQEGRPVCQDKIAGLILGGNLKFAIDSQDKQGFRIILEKEAPVDLSFSWHALAVKDSLTSANDVPANLSLPFEGSFQLNNRFGEQAIDPKVREQDQKIGLYGHDGVDFAMPINTPVLTADDGEVIPIPDGIEEYGITIVIQHKWGRSFYGHLNEVNVKQGQKISKGDKIALSGNSGLSTGSHLHFGMKLNKFNNNNGYLGKVDPLRFLRLDMPTMGTPTPTASPTPSTTPAVSPQSLAVNDNEFGFLRVRSTADVSSAEVAQVTPGQVFKVMEVSGGWYKIEYTENKTGWVAAAYVSIN